MLKRLLFISFILCHVMVNCVWAAAHMAGDDEQAPHVHMLSQHDVEHHMDLVEDDHDDHEENAHDESAHVHLLLHVSHVQSQGFIQQTSSRILANGPFYLSLSYNPPTPPPNA